MTTNICTQLYEFAKSDPGRDIWIEQAGEPVLLVQSLETAQQVLKADATSFEQANEAIRQVCGPSRITENGDDWRFLHQVSQPFLSNVDVEHLVEKVNKHASISVERLMMGSHAAARSENHAILLEMTAAIMTEAFLNRSIKEFGSGCLEDVSMFTRFIGLNFERKDAGKTDGTADTRWLHELCDLRLRWLERVANIKPTIKPQDKLLYRLSGIHARKTTTGSFECELLMLFSAGSDTAATTISWAILLLAQHPDIQQQLRKELVQYRVEDTRDISKILKNDMLLRFISEVFRLYPAVPFVSRRTRTDIKVGEHLVDSGVRVMVSSVGLGRNPYTFKNPDSLNLFQAANPRCPHKATLPFGSGPRRCGGQRIAMIELPIILTIFLQHLRFDLQQPATINFDWQVTMHCEGGVPVNFSRIPQTSNERAV